MSKICPKIFFWVFVIQKTAKSKAIDVMIELDSIRFGSLFINNDGYSQMLFLFLRNKKSQCWLWLSSSNTICSNIWWQVIKLNAIKFKTFGAPYVHIESHFNGSGIRYNTIKLFFFTIPSGINFLQCSTSWVTHQNEMFNTGKCINAKYL